MTNSTSDNWNEIWRESYHNTIRTYVTLKDLFTKSGRNIIDYTDGFKCDFSVALPNYIEDTVDDSTSDNNLLGRPKEKSPNEEIQDYLNRDNSSHNSQNLDYFSNNDTCIFISDLEPDNHYILLPKNDTAIEFKNNEITFLFPKNITNRLRLICQKDAVSVQRFLKQILISLFPPTLSGKILNSLPHTSAKKSISRFADNVPHLVKFYEHNAKSWESATPENFSESQAKSYDILHSQFKNNEINYFDFHYMVLRDFLLNDILDNFESVNLGELSIHPFEPAEKNLVYYEVSPEFMDVVNNTEANKILDELARENMQSAIDIDSINGKLELLLPDIITKSTLLQSFKFVKDPIVSDLAFIPFWHIVKENYYENIYAYNLLSNPLSLYTVYIDRTLLNKIKKGTMTPFSAQSYNYYVSNDMEVAQELKFLLNAFLLKSYESAINKHFEPIMHEEFSEEEFIKEMVALFHKNQVFSKRTKELRISILSELYNAVDIANDNSSVI